VTNISEGGLGGLAGLTLRARWTWTTPRCGALTGKPAIPTASGRFGFCVGMPTQPIGAVVTDRAEGAESEARPERECRAIRPLMTMSSAKSAGGHRHSMTFGMFENYSPGAMRDGRTLPWYGVMAIGLGPQDDCGAGIQLEP
jgi:hypothetical protein